MNIDLKTCIDYGAKLATVCSLIFIAYQAFMAKKNYDINNEKAEREKAIELAKFYHDQILDKLSYIQFVFKETEVEDIIKNIKYYQLKEFNVTELKNILGESTINDIEDKLHNIDIKILINASYMLDESSPNEYLNNLTTIKINETLNNKNGEAAATKIECDKEDSGDEKNNGQNMDEEMLKKFERDKEMYDYYELKYNKKFISTMIDALNLLEYFCMSFNNKIADEEIVYQSLHQTFLGAVKILYFKIAMVNKSGKDKYYTNIIDLYNKWSQRYFQQEKKEEQIIGSIDDITYKKEPVKR